MKNNKTQKFDLTFLLLVFGIVIFGLIILASASGPVAYERFGDSYYFLKHQIFQGLIPGLIAFSVTFFTPYIFWQKNAFPMLLLSLFLLILVFIPGIGADFGTFAHSWVAIGNFSFQPAEIAKFTFLIYLAAWTGKRGKEIKNVNEGLIPFLVILVVMSGLILMQPDMGTLTIIAAMSFAVYFVAGGSLPHLLGIGGLGLTAFWVLISSSPYRAERFTTFMHPEYDPQGIGYQINQALLAIGSGGLMGRGYGHSLQKFQYLPEVIGDSIFAVMSEELGFIFTVSYLLLFLFLLYRGFKIAEGAEDAFGKYFTVGVMTWIGVQAFVNIGAMVSILPITGVPLPFLSYGGTSLIIILAAIGLVLNISRTADN
ncbi:putative lipid II flippase FtsW [Candidatus Uhrbacteria bacterium CG_4_9_14_3_um_filter_41_35]|uniref:Probable peptidoglycan glycosyltransferase FtsW n=1 Tax=Candidatus Uhrbacteria bacterium CG_4_9_14_3_um_filter_41_35 TaxID=1975034 RepID=A0A2M7XDF5_9BACT|nr:MAG: putative lipid II flippase FtsW [Candidatus Uhrbacteria bacterium CG_4_9_14_3_um_filter_41_35]